jgi:antitoxin (DNA-binding transcriptional repressor) of toxin-antitoxin stability system
MGKVTKRDLNQNTAAVLRRVTETDDIVVTEHGKPKWRISVYRQGENVLTRLEREGQYTPPAENPTPWPSQPGGPRYSEAVVEAVIEEIRGDH